MNVERDIRGDFPILQREVRGRELVYLDNAATTQKPTLVIDAISEYYRSINSNVHRAAHYLADEATRALEACRETVRAHINAADVESIVFTRGTTEAINIVAHGLTGELRTGDEILLTVLEHHSNIVPWQMLAERTGAVIRAIDIDDHGDLRLDAFESALNERTRIVTVGHVSNALGTRNPVEQIVAEAHRAGARVLIDGAQAMQHGTVDVQALDCDFYAFSGHKMFGPTGIGVLYGKRELLDALPPMLGGGEMIEHVSLQSSTYQKAPYRFEAGTPHIAGIVGLKAAIDYLDGIPFAALLAQEAKLLQLAVSQLKQIEGVHLVGEPNARTGAISFNVAGAHPHDVGTLLDQQGIAVRTGHHCAMPLMERLAIPGTVRASFSFYNTERDVNRLVEGIHKTKEFL